MVISPELSRLMVIYPAIPRISEGFLVKTSGGCLKIGYLIPSIRLKEQSSYHFKGLCWCIKSHPLSFFLSMTVPRIFPANPPGFLVAFGRHVKWVKE